jgi:hypothetical protein
LLIILGEGSTTPVDPEDLPLSEYVKGIVVDQEVLDLTGATELNTDLLDVNAIAPEQKDLWVDAAVQDPDCHIIEDPRANVPAKTPPPEEPRPGDPDVEIFNMHRWMLSSQTHRQLYFFPRAWSTDLVAKNP